MHEVDSLCPGCLPANCQLYECGPLGKPTFGCPARWLTPRLSVCDLSRTTQLVGWLWEEPNTILPLGFRAACYSTVAEWDAWEPRSRFSDFTVWALQASKRKRWAKLKRMISLLRVLRIEFYSQHQEIILLSTAGAGPAAKSTCCSCRGPGFYCQPLYHEVIHLELQLQGIQYSLSSGLLRYQNIPCHTNIQTHINQNQTNNKSQPGVVAHAFDSSSPEAETAILWGQDQPGLLHTLRPCLKLISKV